MDYFLKGLSTLAAVFLVMTLVINTSSRFPRFPGDIMIDKFGFRIYLPFISSVVIAIFLMIFMKSFKAPGLI